MFFALILADTLPVTPTEVFGFLGSLGMLLVIYNQAMKAFGHEPPLHEQYVSKEEHQKLEAHMNAEDKKMDERIEKMSKKIEDGFAHADTRRSTSIAGIHNRITELLGEVRQMKGEIARK